MNYKKLIKNRSTRLKIVNSLRWIPDKQMLKLQYRIKMGSRLDLKNPKKYSEKIQWYKLYYKNPLMVKCSDKYEVRDYVISRGLESILVNCYGVFESADDINFNNLPGQFVMKNTLGGGGSENSLFICKEKNEVSINHAKELAKEWLNNKSPINVGREWPYYSGKKRRIIIEEFLQNDNDSSLVDYKFLCFGGKVEYLYILSDREYGVKAKFGVLDRECEKIVAWDCHDYKLDSINRPDNYSEMLDIAEKLAEPFPYVRVDLYNVDGKIYFGELTFFDSSGYPEFDPPEFDDVLGEKFILQEYKGE